LPWCFEEERLAPVDGKRFDRDDGFIGGGLRLRDIRKANHLL
jgi:hypothetical protein